jgi:hypothetical protein
MGPLSAVAVAVSFLILGLTWIAWTTASTHALGVIFIIAAIVVLLDAFWIGSGTRYGEWRGNRGNPQA